MKTPAQIAAKKIFDDLGLDNSLLEPRTIKTLATIIEQAYAERERVAANLVKVTFEQTIPGVSWYRHESWPAGEYRRFEHGHTMSQNIEGFEFFNEDTAITRATSGRGGE